jgi:hypothetical protein
MGKTFTYMLGVIGTPIVGLSIFLYLYLHSGPLQECQIGGIIVAISVMILGTFMAVEFLKNPAEEK